MSKLFGHFASVLHFALIASVLNYFMLCSNGLPLIVVYVHATSGSDCLLSCMFSALKKVTYVDPS